MKDIAREMKYDLQKIKEVRSRHLSNHYSTDEITMSKKHDFLFSVYTIVVPELLILIFEKLQLIKQTMSVRERRDYDVDFGYRFISDTYFGEILNDAYERCRAQGEVNEAIDLLDFYAQECVETLSQLESK